MPPGQCQKYQERATKTKGSILDKTIHPILWDELRATLRSRQPRREKMRRFLFPSRLALIFYSSEVRAAVLWLAAGFFQIARRCRCCGEMLGRDRSHTAG
jgi:hypothetical protein